MQRQSETERKTITTVEVHQSVCPPAPPPPLPYKWPAGLTASLARGVVKTPTARHEEYIHSTVDPIFREISIAAYLLGFSNAFFFLEIPWKFLLKCSPTQMFSVV
jgi:hypothetical protein